MKKENTKTTLWIESINLLEIENEICIPTQLCYTENAILYGQKANLKEKITNKNFKVELGDINRTSIYNREKFLTENGTEKSAFELSKDYFELMLGNIHTANKKDNGNISAKIMIAEPLAFQVNGHSKDWITNYRRNIKNILTNYEVVDFLPEPFAVYQYYRYGLRIPQLKDDSKHIAFVVDFGGGTFDACIIESTRDGDISQAGKHSKPISADSSPTGGFHINDVITQYLIKRNLEGLDRKKCDQALKTYNNIKKGQAKIFDLSEEKKNFIKNYENLLSRVEKYKIQLTNSINDWNIDSKSDNYKKIEVEIPLNPFSSSEKTASEFYCHEFRKIYIDQVWEEKLKGVVKSVLSRATEDLKGKSITTTLISGGSSNIRWLGELLSLNFKDYLSKAEPLPLSTSFQEIVSKGLAIECARRHYDETSEFVSVTYNPIMLTLNPDNRGNETKRFTSIENKIDMDGLKDGELIPSSQTLVNFIENPLQWKVKLSHAPKQSLKYIFSKSNKLDSDQNSDIYNPENNVVYTKDSKSFDSQIKIELNIRKDGTVEPKFIYKTGSKLHKIPEHSVTGNPFAIDMTYDAQQQVSTKNYIGFDFGTSNSSLCQLSSANIKIIKDRSNNDNWLSLKDALKFLPYPVALSLRKYLDINKLTDIATTGRDAFEAALAFATYTAVSEALSKDCLGKQLSNFQHRSLGPLKALLETCLEALGNNATYSKPYQKLFTDYKEDFELAIREFTDHKHDKLAADKIDIHRHLLLIINVLKESMKNKHFGFCNHIERTKFAKNKYNGHFKVAHDAQPFSTTLKYQGSVEFGMHEVFIYDIKTKNYLLLYPFISLEETESYSSPYTCSWLDKILENDVILKPCDRKGQICVSDISEELLDLFYQIKSNDHDKELFSTDSILIEE